MTGGTDRTEEAVERGGPGEPSARPEPPEPPVLVVEATTLPDGRRVARYRFERRASRP